MATIVGFQAIQKHKINLYVNKTAAPEVVVVNQGDDLSHWFDINLYNSDDQQMGLVPPMTLKLQIEKPDKTISVADLISDPSSLTMSFRPGAQAYTVAGDCLCFVQAVGPSDDGVTQFNYAAPPFILRVRPTEYNTLASSDEKIQVSDIIGYIKEAESWAKGGTGVRQGEDTNNAKYYAEQAAGENPAVWPVPRGGTGKSSWTPNGIIYPSAATTLAQTPIPPAANSFLTQGPSGAPAWKNPTDAAVAMLGVTSGSWTPVLKGSGGSNIGIINGVCTYYRTGKSMWFSFDITIGSIDFLGSGEYLIINGLPANSLGSGNTAMPSGMCWYRLATPFAMVYASKESTTSFVLRGTKTASAYSADALILDNLRTGGTDIGTRLVGSVTAITV